jgi:hypothetical protein
VVKNFPIALIILPALVYKWEWADCLKHHRQPRSSVDWAVK